MVRAHEVLRARPDLTDTLRDVDGVFAIRITRSFWDRLDPTDPADPLGLQVMPDPRELEAHPQDEPDPVGDAACSPVPWVVHKYPNRVLLLATKRCHLHCRYCFRRNHHPSAALDPTPEEWAMALDYVRNAGVEEVILSGGDPLMLTDRQLDDTLSALSNVPVRRIHTRAPITYPQRVTQGFVDLLRRHGPLWVIVHCNHPRELSHDVDDALARMVDAGVPVLNQAVLLRGVNADVETLTELCRAMLRRRVRPYYLHVTDRAAGNAHLRVSTEEARQLEEALAPRLSGLSRPRFVLDPPAGTGKIDISHAAACGKNPGSS
ncbi:MAG: KamA family radical SAM protein [Myxococcota bacterium]